MFWGAFVQKVYILGIVVLIMYYKSVICLLFMMLHIVVATFLLVVKVCVLLRLWWWFVWCLCHNVNACCVFVYVNNVVLVSGCVVLFV